MQQESEFFRTLFDDAPLPCQSLDSEGRLLTVNQAWQEELGYEKHEILGRWFGDFLSSEQRTLFRERFSQFVTEGSVQGVVWMLVRKDGTKLSVSFNGRIIRDSDGRFLRTCCLFFDLSTRSEAEEQLRESEELRSAFLESAQEGFALFDPDLTLLYANEACAHILGIPVDELVGRSMLEISPETADTSRISQYRNVAATGEPFSIDYYQPPARFGDRRFAVRAFRVGENVGTILRDVTDTALAEARLRDSEARWRSLAEGSPDHVLVLDRDLKIEYVNFPSPGLTKKDLLGKYICTFAPGEQATQVRNTLEEVLRTGTSASYETTYDDPDGARIFYESRAVPRVVGADTVGLIVSSRDITARKANELRISSLLSRETAMAKLAIDFGRVQSVIDIYRRTHTQVSEMMDADVFIISRYDPESGDVRADYFVSDATEQDVGGLSTLGWESEGSGAHRKVIQTGEPMVIPDYRTIMSASQGLRHEAEGDRAGRTAVSNGELAHLPQSALLVPMKVRGEVLGVIQVQSMALDRYGTEDAAQLSGLASVVAVALENRDLLRKSQTAFEGVIQALVRAIDLRDPYTSQHQQGVAQIAVKMGRRLGLSDDQIRAIELAANVHDIGKIMIPAEILSKPTTLSQAQMLIVQSHVEAAHQVLEGIPFPWPIDEIVIQHHERLDGSGYPRQLTADTIRTEARILAVADIADAMLSHRPYRPAHTLAATVSELQMQRGVSLDTASVDACIRLLEDEGIGAKLPA